MINSTNFYVEEINDEMIFGLYYKGIWNLFTMEVKFKFDFLLIFAETSVANLITRRPLLLHNFPFFSH